LSVVIRLLSIEVQKLILCALNDQIPLVLNETVCSGLAFKYELKFLDARSEMSLEQIIGAPYSMSQRSESIRHQESKQMDEIKKLLAKVEHANSLLAESEATNSRLEDQSSILKVCLIKFKSLLIN
jgi:hypothetical protein